MPEIIKPNVFSFSSLFVEPLFGDNPMGVATGLIWNYEGSNYLVTNWHVMTGLHPQTQQPIDTHGTRPEKLRIWLHLENDIGAWETLDVSLFDNQGRPLWKEHKEFRSKVDVAIIKLSLPTKFRTFPINEIPIEDIRSEVGGDVFIIGFPLGITSDRKFPIWKNGSIASEPEINLEGLPKLLIDSMTREGMSGSPVILQFVGLHAEDANNIQPTDWIGMARKFIGVYSGRLPGQDEFEAHLGIVWKAGAIEDILKSGVRPD